MPILPLCPCTAGDRRKFTFYFYAPWLERNIILVITWFGFVKSICILKTGVHLVPIHRFQFTGSGTCAGVQLFSICRFSFSNKECVLAYLWFVSTDFYLQQPKEHVLVYCWPVSKDDYLQQAKEHVLIYSWSLFKMIIYRRQKNMYWCTAGLSPRWLFTGAKEHALVYRWPVSKMIIYSRQRKTYCFKVVSTCRFLFAGKGTHTGVQQVSILRFLY